MVIFKLIIYKFISIQVESITQKILNMVFASFTCRVVFIWATLLTCCSAASEISSIQLEKQALLNTTWWSFDIYNTSDHCKWKGITCYSAGSITGIVLHDSYFGAEFGRLNFSSFPNLEILSLSRINLFGEIPPQIGALSKLKFLYLDENYLTG